MRNGRLFWRLIPILFSVCLTTVTASETFALAQEKASPSPLEVLVAAEQGDPTAQVRLGVSCYSAMDYVEAAKWFLKAAEQGDGPGQFWLAHMYEMGEGVSKDYVEAVKWYRKAAENGPSIPDWVPLRLALSYAEGEGVNQDYAEAAKWCRKAAVRGNPVATAMLGAMYYEGRGVSQDYDEAAKWLTKAAEKGHADAQFYLGYMYVVGKGVPQNYAQAAKWYLKAAEQGKPDAQFRLGLMFYAGNGVPQNYVQAHLWLNLAAATEGEEQAKRMKWRDSVAVKMTPQQISQAQQLARSFRPRVAQASSDRDESTATPREPGQVTGTGTGFFITEDGYLVTAAHVLADGSTFRVMTAKGVLPARLVKCDSADDLAVLKAEGGQFALALQSSRGVRLGQSVATVGFPNVGLQGFMPKAARGDIAGLAGAQDNPLHFQISVPVQPGNSGGPLVDLRGNVVGVVVAKLDQETALASSGALAENVNYAIKSGFLLTLLESLPAVSGGLLEPSTHDIDFEDVISRVEKATVLVLAYR